MNNLRPVFDKIYKNSVIKMVFNIIIFIIDRFKLNKSIK